MIDRPGLAERPAQCPRLTIAIAVENKGAFLGADQKMHVLWQLEAPVFVLFKFVE
jgi:hypothetical protein